MRYQSAMTLPELMLALAVLAIVVATAVPALDSVLLNIRMSNSVNELIHSLYNARQNTNATGISTALCGSVDGLQCSISSNWAQGWLLFTNNDDDEPPQIDPGEGLLAGGTWAAPLHLSANRMAFITRPFGLRSTNGTLVWCDRRGAAHARAVIISFTGKPRISTTTASGAALRCPDMS